MNATAIIQVRLQSTRLKSKALLPLAGRPMIEHVIERAKAIDNVSNVILATGKCTDDTDNSPLKVIAEKLSVDFFEGEPDNVLNRFYHASLIHDSDFYVRITGDNPLTDFKSAGEAVIHAEKTACDHCYVSGIPVGTGIEVISRSALERAFHSAVENHHFEHVTPYIKENPEIFKMEVYTVKKFSKYDYRLTVDTKEDYDVMAAIYDALYTGSPIELDDAIEFLDRNPEIAALNRHIEQRPMTHSSLNG